ncbi:MAG TPA: DUF4012 domain-containing protein [Acidimicrobiales bacterium]|nr:DUF4012 domain-containing protein [Acidimicrobiales bacterium]
MADHSSRSARLAALAGGAILLCWLALAALTLVGAHHDVDQGVDSIDKARAHADAAAVAEGRLLPPLRHARGQFAKAHSRVTGPVLAPLRVLPFVGRQLSSVAALAGSATKATDAAIGGTIDAERALAAPPGNIAARSVTARDLAGVAARVDQRLNGLSLGPSHGLLPPLARARNRMAGELDVLRSTLNKGAVGGTALADFLTGPHRYLVFAANNAEMRAGSGMFLSVGELETGPDGIHLGEMRSVTEILLPKDAVPVTGDLAARWGWLSPGVDWRNLMTSPRFEAAAPLAAQMWVALGNRPVDGVLALDPVALSGMLGAVGPVDVGGHRIDQDNVEDELLHGQYLRFPSDADVSQRRDELGALASAVFDQLDTGSWSVSKLGSGLAGAAGGRHLLLWSAQSAQETAWQTLGVDGALHPDSLLVSVLNRGGNKLDWFLHVSSDVKVRSVGPDSEVSVTMHLDNRVPDGEPTEIAGPDVHSGVSAGVYLGIVTVDLPGAARDARFDGVTNLAVVGPDGPSQVIGFQLDVPQGTQRTVVARFRLPGRRGSLRVEPSARVPAIKWTSGSTSWSDGTSAKFLTWKA